MAGELYRTYEVLIEESIHPGHSKRAKDRTSKRELFNKDIDDALRDTHMIFQDAVGFYTLCIAGLAGNEKMAVGEELKLVNPLWSHLTTEESKGGIREKTMLVIRRLATHYSALDIDENSTPEEFVNHVYSEPLRIAKEMTIEQRTAALATRLLCYRLMEKYGLKQKKSGGFECADMASYANTWARLVSVPDSDTEIPGNGAYDRVSRELKQIMEAGDAGNRLDVLFEEILLRYSTEAEKRNQQDCDEAYQGELEKRQAKVAAVLASDDPEKAKQRKLDAAKQSVKEFEEQEAKDRFCREFFDNRRANLRKAARATLEKPFELVAADVAGLTSDAFKKLKEEIANSAATIEGNTESLIRLSYKGGNPNKLEKAILRYWMLRGSNEVSIQRAAAADFRLFVEQDKPEPVPEIDGEHFLEMPYKSKGANCAFPLFGAKCLGISGIKDASPDWEFDKTAFATAAEDVFKYKIRTSERERKVRKLLAVIDSYEGNGEKHLPAEDSPTGKALTIRGMKDDPRWKGNGKNRGIEQMLEDMRNEKGLDSYGLREGTIGGWAEVRKMLLRRHRQCLGKPRRMAVLPDWLEKGVDKEQTANRQGFGSADFFHALCDPDFFHLWLGGSQDEHHGIKDFIPHYVSYCEWREELIDLLIQDDGKPMERGIQMTSEELRNRAKKPISYTWPGLLNRHKKPSYRYFDFAADLNASFKFPCLFRRVREKGKLVGYKKLSGDDAKATLAARRLKRDKIMTLDGKSVDALWCPPLILEGRSEPNTKNAPRAGKYDDPKKKIWPTGDIEVSFSLMAAPLPDDEWSRMSGLPAPSETPPVHLTVSFKLEAEGLTRLHQDVCHFVSGSLKGVDEEGDNRKFFRWPVDIESDKMAAAEAERKAKEQAQKDGKEWKKPKRKPDVKAEDLWCHGTEGFTVKESRFSKTEKVKKVDDLHILAIDLGNRFTAGAVKLRIHRDADVPGRVISADESEAAIKASMVGNGFTLRLQGEDADVWQLVTEKNQKYVTRKLHSAGQKREAVVGTFEFVREKYGNEGRGRYPDAKLGEFEKFEALARRLVPEESLSLKGKDKETLPELGDHLIFRLKRRIGRLRTLFNLLWRLCGDKEKDRKGKYTLARQPELAFHKRMVMETLARSAFPKRVRPDDEKEDQHDSSLRLKLALQPAWDKWNEDKLFESMKGAGEEARGAKLEAEAKAIDPARWVELADAIKDQIKGYCEGVDALDKLLVEVIEFCLPLRGRHWGWDRARVARLHWDRKDEKHFPKLEGMRGLSMRRLGQILDLRQRCQSFAKLEDRYHDKFLRGEFNPPDSVAKEEVDDVCPLLLERSNRIREARVEQAAHLILAEALGMELKNPATVHDKFSKKDDASGQTISGRKTLVDLHGEYQRRKIRDKDGKEQDCPRCSVIVLENLERYKTSQERTKAENSRLMKWSHRAIIEKLEDMCKPFGITIMLVDPAFSSHFDSRTGLPGVRVNKVSRGFEERYPYNKWINDKTKSGGETQLARDIKKLKKQFDDNPKFEGELLLAVEGGKEFLPVNGTISDLHNADITAAMNVGLRAVADPQRWEIFPRLRTKRVGDGKVSVTNWRGPFGRFASGAMEREMRSAAQPAAGMEAAQEATETPKTETKKKGGKSKAAPRAADEGGDDSKTAQSSEFPPFFVEHPEHDWVPKNDWLKKAALEFEMNGKRRLAYPQGAYLKRVEQECGYRITEINDRQINSSTNPDSSDEIPFP